MKVSAWIALFVCIMLPAVSTASGTPDAVSPNCFIEKTFQNLERIKDMKKRQILSLLKSAEKKAKGAAHDKTLLKFFRVMDRDKKLLAEGSGIPAELKKAIVKYQRSIDGYYLNRYLEFYDILFIDSDGFVFYSIRKESDYRANILKGHLKTTSLAKCLQSEKHEFFIDFEHYSPADEPAAFFLIRVCRGGVHRGWIVFQYALNMLNALMVDYDELGETGEVYIVNREYSMLTQSRFKGENSSMNVRVDTEAVRCAMKQQSGKRIITGYRGTRVLVVFERFSLWDTSWVIIASIEEAEVLTNYYRNHGDRCRKRMEAALKKLPRTAAIDWCGDKMMKKVDMDEFEKAENDQIIGTRGVSSCTAVTASIPGRFGYLAHISTHDKIYDSANPLHTLKNMVRRITGYDIYLHEMHRLRFVIVATHTKSLRTIMSKLLKYGIMISQITFAYNPDAHYANVTYDGSGSRTIIQWVHKSSFGEGVFQDAGSIPTLGYVLKQTEFKKSVFLRAQNREAQIQ